MTQEPTPPPTPVPGQAAPVVAAPPPGAPPSAAEMLAAARAQRSELRNQLERAESRREELQSEIQQTSDEAVRAGLITRLQETDARISALDKEIAVADQRVAAAAAVPGATIEPPRPIIQRTGPPEEAWVLGGVFIFFVMMPLAVGYARRLWKRAAVSTVAEMPAELTDRLNRLEQAVDAVAVELERVGEGQRYVTRVFSEQQRVLGGGAAEPIEVRQREAVPQARP